MLQLAAKEIALLEKNKGILKARAKVLSEEVMSEDDRLQKGNLSAQARRSLEHRRRQRLDELQAIESQMLETRKNLARVKAQTGSEPKRSY
jgi:hypothetical protein